MNEEKKTCQHCGAEIDVNCVVCPVCGKQVGQVAVAPQNIVINNSNVNTNVVGRKKCNKWTAFLLCFFLGMFGAHKFYEGKTGMGVLYLFTMGLFGIGWLIDTISILFKPDPYYV